MTQRLTPKQEVDIITAFTLDLVPMIDLAKRYGRTRQGIWKVLKRNGIKPSDYGQIQVSCSACGSAMTKHRSQVRHKKYLFCCQECYYAFLEGRQQGEYNGNRQGQRVARAIVSNYFKLLPGHIVHHEDRNTRNNSVKNLKVFANQGDHIRYHRWSKDGIDVRPVWDGSSA